MSNPRISERGPEPWQKLRAGAAFVRAGPVAAGDGRCDRPRGFPSVLPETILGMLLPRDGTTKAQRRIDAVDNTSRALRECAQR